ncbi:MAG: 1-acyl-sn-glycerol-3-phosphate acyltransferase [Gammaproteobacteria bacterium]|nr:1-acyl-sn-glycerol-3-phosphate acyltransferase [Gammaproteobacteria bacterium]
MAFLRSLLFSIVMIVVTVLISTLGILFLPTPFKFRWHIIRLWSVINLQAIKYICGINYEITGKENIPDETAIIFSKHQSTWETFALQQIFPPQVYVIKRELLWIPFFGWGIAVLNPIAINRSSGHSAIRQVVEKGTARLKNGEWIVIFPEGTRVRPGEKKRYKMGGAILAAESGYPIVPVAHNAGYYWQKGQFIKKPGTIKVVIGPVINTKGRKPDEIIKDVEEWIESTMERITIL